MPAADPVKVEASEEVHGYASLAAGTPTTLTVAEYCSPVVPRGSHEALDIPNGQPMSLHPILKHPKVWMELVNSLINKLKSYESMRPRNNDWQGTDRSLLVVGLGHAPYWALRTIQKFNLLNAGLPQHLHYRFAFVPFAAERPQDQPTPQQHEWYYQNVLRKHLPEIEEHFIVVYFKDKLQEPHDIANAFLARLPAWQREQVLLIQACEGMSHPHRKNVYHESFCSNSLVGEVTRAYRTFGDCGVPILEITEWPSDPLNPVMPIPSSVERQEHKDRVMWMDRRLVSSKK